MREPTVVNMKFGSHLYGLNTPNSDIDYKGIYIPTLREIMLGKYAKTFKSSTGAAHEKNQAGDIDLEVISLPRFIEMGIQGETLVLDMLHCNEPLLSSDLWEKMVENRTKFYSKSLKAFVGYVKRQAAKYGIKGSRLSDIDEAIQRLSTFDPSLTIGDVKQSLYYGEFAKWIVQEPPRDGMPTQFFYEVNMKKYQSTNSVGYVIEQLQKVWDSYGHRAKQAKENDGVDWKAMSHALRAGYQARDIYMNGDFEYPLKETEFLLKVKKGELDYTTEVAPELERLVDEVNKLSETSTLPEKVDVQFWEEFLLDAYSTEFCLVSIR